MVYIYKDINSGEIKFTRSATEAASIPMIMSEDGIPSVITLEKMIPQPTKEGYQSVLHADFETGQVWYELEVTLDQAKKEMVKLAKDYKIKSLNLNLPEGKETFWIDSKTRATILNSLKVEKQIGNKVTHLFINERAVLFPIEAAICLMNRMDRWDKEVFEVEANHIINIHSLETIEEVRAYDYTVGYPSDLWASIGGLESEYQKEASKNSLDILLEFSTSIINTVTMSDENVKRFKHLYPTYGNIMGIMVPSGFIFQYNTEEGREPKLYEVIKAHTISEYVKPDTENQDYYQLID